jgi:hypothetical protein
MQLEDYQEELEEMKNMTRQEYVLYARVPQLYYNTVCITCLAAGHLNIQFDLATKQLLASVRSSEQSDGHLGAGRAAVSHGARPCTGESQGLNPSHTCAY